MGRHNRAVTLTTPDDSGVLTAEIVFFEPTIRNEIVFLAGDTVTYGEVADKLEVAFGRPFKRSVWTVPTLLEELANDPNNMMRKYRAAFAIGRGMSWPKAGTFNDRQGIPVTDVAALIKADRLAAPRAT